MRCLVSGRACASLVSVTGTAPPAFLSGPGILTRPGIPLRANQNLLDDRLVHHLWYEHTAILTGRQVGGEQAERYVAGAVARNDFGGPGEIGDGPGRPEEIGDGPGGPEEIGDGPGGPEEIGDGPGG